MKKTLLLGIACVSILSSAVQAQVPVQLLPLEGNPILQSTEKEQFAHSARNSINCTEITISLPFFDDFANHNGYYPSCDRWIDKNTFVNQSMAYDPPTVGVVTLDGLNERGYPYNKGASPNASNPSDTLTSQPMDLSIYSLSDNIALSFYYQKQGLGDRPEVGDSLIVEFKDTASNWNRVYDQAGADASLSSTALIDFAHAFVRLQDSAYLHNNFQFRFRNLAAICGNNDHWHLDYIYMDANRVDSTTQAPDVAFSEPPLSPFEDYMAIPWRHFDSTFWNNTVSLETRNYSGAVGALNLSYNVMDLDLPGTNSNPVLLTDALPVIPFYGASPSADDTNEEVGVAANYQTFSPTDATILECNYVIENPVAFQTPGVYSLNDTAKRQVHLNNYFAYDDGTAELRIVAQSIGTQIAVEHQTTVADTLRGIYFHMPHFINRDASDLDFINIKVWVDSLSEDTEAFTKDIFRLQYADAFNGYYFVELTDFLGNKTPLRLTAGQKFYIGWQQASSTPVPIGYDRSTDSRSKIWVDVGANSWSSAGLDLQGSIMMRPLLSPLDTFSMITGAREIETVHVQEEQFMRLYPNPITEDLNIDLYNIDEPSQYQIRIINVMGQTVEQQNYEQTIQLGGLPKGVYFLGLYNEYGQLITQDRFIKQ